MFHWIIKRQLKKLGRGLEPDAEWKRQTRENLLARIRLSDAWKNPERRHSGYGGNFVEEIFTWRTFKPVAITGLVFSVALSGSIASVSAARASLPGDSFYPVKLGIERVQVGLVFSEERKAELEVSFAGNRLDEVSEIIEEAISATQEESVEADNGQNVAASQEKIEKTAERIETAISQFTKGMDSVEKRLDKISGSENAVGSAVEISKLVNEKTLALEEDLVKIKAKADVPAVTPAAVEKAPSPAEVKEGSSNSEVPREAAKTAEDKGLMASIETALSAVDNANTKSLAVIVEKAVAGGDQSLQQEAVQKLQAKVSTLEKKIENTQDKIEKIVTLQDAIAQADSNSASSTPTAITLPSNPTETSTEPVLAPKVEVEQVLKETVDKPKQAKETIQEAKKILETDKVGETAKLGEALQKVLEVRQIVESANQNIRTVEKHLQTETITPAGTVVPASGQAGTPTTTSQTINPSRPSTSEPGKETVAATASSTLMKIK